MINRNTKGFTLVEIIVVLVIIAILAATTLPALAGYIEQARDKTAMSEAKTCMTAVQAISAELYSLGFESQQIVLYVTTGDRGKGSKRIPDSFTKTVASLTGDEYFKDPTKIKHLMHNDAGTIMLFELYTSNGRSVVYKDGTMYIGTVVNKP